MGRGDPTVRRGASTVTTGGILTLDLSRRTGWALGHPGEMPWSGVWALPAVGDAGATGAALIERLDDMLALNKPRLIVCEAPLGIRAQTSNHTARLQFGLAYVVELCGHWSDVQVREEKVDDVRRAMMGRCRFGKEKNAAKDAVMAWCLAKGVVPPDHNAGDAVVLWFYACRLLLQGNGRK